MLERERADAETVVTELNERLSVDRQRAEAEVRELELEKLRQVEQLLQ